MAPPLSSTALGLNSLSRDARPCVSLQALTFMCHIHSWSKSNVFIMCRDSDCIYENKKRQNCLGTKKDKFRKSIMWGSEYWKGTNIQFAECLLCAIHFTSSSNSSSMPPQKKSENYTFLSCISPRRLKQSLYLVNIRTGVWAQSHFAFKAEGFVLPSLLPTVVRI